MVAGGGRSGHGSSPRHKPGLHTPLLRRHAQGVSSLQGSEGLGALRSIVRDRMGDVRSQRRWCIELGRGPFLVDLHDRAPHLPRKLGRGGQGRGLRRAAAWRELLWRLAARRLDGFGRLRARVDARGRGAGRNSVAGATWIAGWSESRLLSSGRGLPQHPVLPGSSYGLLREERVVGRLPGGVPAWCGS